MDQTLFELIKEESLIKNKSLTDVANEIGISYATLYNTRDRKPSRVTYHKLANYFNINIRDLIKYPIK